MDDPIPTPLVDRGSARLRVTNNVKTKTAPQPTLEPEEDAPVAVPGVGTGLLQAAEGLVDAGVAVGRKLGRAGGDGRKSATSLWLAAIVGLLTGSGGSIGANELFGDDEAVAAKVEREQMIARLDAADKERTAISERLTATQEKLASRIDAEAARTDATESAIADAEVTRLTEVRYLIELSVKGFEQLGVLKSDLPAVPSELAARYRDTEVAETRRKLFEKPDGTAGPEPDRISLP